MSDVRIIEAFGEASSLVDAFRARGVPITRSAVYQWKKRGIAPRWRQLVAEIAHEQGVSLPRGFEPKPKAHPKQRAQSTR
jgi:hypothetical protein